MCVCVSLQGGEDSQDPLSLQVIFRKSDLYLMALLWEMICNLGDPMSLRHPVIRHRKESLTICVGVCGYYDTTDYLCGCVWVLRHHTLFVCVYVGTRTYQ